MTKRHLTGTEAFDLRQALHVATLDALMASRRWQPGDLVFQGGTSLHLAHGSPRFSEDLDFLVNASLKLDAIAEAVGARLRDLPWLPAGTNLSVSKAKDDRNPHAFVVSIGGVEVIGAVRVKVEFWKTDEKALATLNAIVAPVQLARGPVAGMQTFVPTAGLPDIYADKVFALAARPYLKPRDVFDLHWLAMRGDIYDCSKEDMQVRLATYPRETPAEWIEKAFSRREELKSATPHVMADLKRWLPSTWPLDVVHVEAMTVNGITALENGIDAMREIEADYRDENGSTMP